MKITELKRATEREINRAEAVYGVEHPMPDDAVLRELLEEGYDEVEGWGSSLKFFDRRCVDERNSPWSTEYGVDIYRDGSMEFWHRGTGKGCFSTFDEEFNSPEEYVAEMESRRRISELCC